MKRATRAWDSEIRQRWLRSWTDRHGPVEEAEPAPAARRIGNRFPPPPLFLHEPGRFQGTQADPSRLDGCRQTLASERVKPQTTHRQSVTETRSNGFDSRRRWIVCGGPRTRSASKRAPSGGQHSNGPTHDRARADRWARRQRDHRSVRQAGRRGQNKTRRSLNVGTKVGMIVIGKYLSVYLQQLTHF